MFPFQKKTISLLKPPKKSQQLCHLPGGLPGRDVTSRLCRQGHWHGLSSSQDPSQDRQRHNASSRVRRHRYPPQPAIPDGRYGRSRGPQNVGRIRSLGPKISLRLGATPCHRVWVFRWGTFGGLKFKCQKFGGFRYSYILQEGGKVMNMCMFTNCETSFFESVSDIKIQQTRVTMISQRE